MWINFLWIIFIIIKEITTKRNGRLKTIIIIIIDNIIIIELILRTIITIKVTIINYTSKEIILIIKTHLQIEYIQISIPTTKTRQDTTYVRLLQIPIIETVFRISTIPTQGGLFNNEITNLASEKKVYKISNTVFSYDKIIYNNDYIKRICDEI